MKRNDAAIKELKKDIASKERYIKRHPDDAEANYNQAEPFVQLVKLENNQKHYVEALKLYSKAIKLDPENPSYLTARSKLHVILGRNDLAARDITEAQKAPDTGNKLLNMYNTNTTQDILKMDGVQNEVKDMISRGELPPGLSAVFEDMIGVISGISARVSEHDERLGAHDERFEKDEAKLKEVEKRLAEYEKQYPALTQIIETMKGEVGSLKSRLIIQEEKVEGHDKAIIGLKNEAAIAMKDLEKRIEKTELSEKDRGVINRNINDINKAVGEIMASSKASEEIMKAVVSNIKELQEAKELDEGTVFEIYEKVMTIEEGLKKEGAQDIKAFAANNITYDNPLLNYPELFIRTANTVGANKAVELGKSLSPDLIRQAYTTADHEILLAGLMSLDQPEYNII